MPQINTRGKKPGIRLSKSEQSRWEAVIEDLRVIERNSPDKSQEKFWSKETAGALEKLLASLVPQKETADDLKAAGNAA